MKKLIVLILFLAALGGLARFLWTEVDLYFNREYRLTIAYQTYTGLYDSQACREAYEFLTTGAKQTYSYDRFKVGCEADRNISEISSIKDIVFLNAGFARINVRQEMTDGKDKHIRDRATSWQLENNNWRRDWPN